MGFMVLFLHILLDIYALVTFPLSPASIMNKQRDLCEASTLERRRRAFRGQHSLIDPMYTPLEQYVSAI